MVDLSPRGHFVKYTSSETGETVVVEIGDRQVSQVISIDDTVSLWSDEMATIVSYGDNEVTAIQHYELPGGEPGKAIDVSVSLPTEFIEIPSSGLMFYNYENRQAETIMNASGELNELANPFELRLMEGGTVLKNFIGEWQTLDSFAIRTLETGDAIWSAPSEKTSEISVSPSGDRVAYEEDGTIWIETLPFAPGPLVEIACGLLPFDTSTTDYTELGLPVSAPICQRDHRSSARMQEIEQLWSEVRD